MLAGLDVQWRGTAVVPDANKLKIQMEYAKALCARLLCLRGRLCHA